MITFLALAHMLDATQMVWGGGGGWWGTFGSMRRGGFFHHKIHIKHQDLSQKDGRYDMVMLMTWV